MPIMPLTADLTAPRGLYPKPRLPSDVNNIILKIKQIFERSSILSAEDKNDVFLQLNTLREKLSLCPKAEYFHRSAYYRQAEKIFSECELDYDLTLEQLRQLEVLAPPYVVSYRFFKRLVKSRSDISTNDLISSLGNLAESHLKFSRYLASTDPQVQRKERSV